MKNDNIKKNPSAIILQPSNIRKSQSNIIAEEDIDDCPFSDVSKVSNHSRG